MKKIIISLVCACMCLCAYAQSYSIKVSADVPSAAAEILQQRFAKLLQDGGLAVEEEAAPVEISASVVERMETPGSMSQSVVVLDVKAAVGEVEQVFTVKGVGKDEADAWTRAVKQILPSSKQAREFVEKLK